MGAVGESVVLGVRRREQNALVNRENICVLTLLLLVFGRSVEHAINPSWEANTLAEALKTMLFDS